MKGAELVILCDCLEVQGGALSVFRWFFHVHVMSDSPVPLERQMTKPNRTVIPYLALPFRTKQ